MSKLSPPILPSEITPPELFFNRRQIVAGAVAAGLRGVAHADDAPAPAATKLSYTKNAQLSVDEKPNAYEEVTGYNNFYEFGTDKSDPKANAGAFKTHPWNVTVDGEAEVKGTFTLEDILKPHAL